LTCANGFTDIFNSLNARWQKSGTGTAAVGGGVLALTAPLKTTDTSETLSLTKNVSGDFSEEVDFTALTQTKKIPLAQQILQVTQPDGTPVAEIERDAATTSGVIRTNAYVGGSWGTEQDATTSAAAFRVMIQRKDNTITTYYKKAVTGSYIQLGSYSGTYTGNVVLGLYASSMQSHPGNVSKFDNFTLSCVGAAAASPSPSPSPSPSASSSASLSPSSGTLDTTTVTSNVTKPLPITQSGTYVVECRPCKGTTCVPFQAW
jgi:hypothetical protein